MYYLLHIYGLGAMLCFLTKKKKKKSSRESFTRKAEGKKSS